MCFEWPNEVDMEETFLKKVGRKAHSSKLVIWSSQVSVERTVFNFSRILSHFSQQKTFFQRKGKNRWLFYSLCMIYFNGFCRT